VSSGRYANLAGKEENDPDGFYCARPGYDVDVWSTFPIPNLQNRICNWTLVRILRSTGVVCFTQTYDIAKNGTMCDKRSSADLAKDLNESTSDQLVIVFTTETADDAKQNFRLREGLPEALYRCGASEAVFASEKFEDSSAYCLIGIPTCGEGKAFEVNQGNKAHALLDVSFKVTDQGWKMKEVHVDEVDSSCMISSKSFFLAALHKRTEEENYTWKLRQKDTMPTYWTLCRLELQSMKECLDEFFLFKYLLCFLKPLLWPPLFLLTFFGFGHLLSSVGRKCLYVNM